MTPPLNRLLAIKAAAAGPYKVTGKCFDCGEEEGLVNFPRLFSTGIAICRRCRFVRTGVEDRRGMIRGTATIIGPAELVEDTTTCAPSGRDFTPPPDIRPPNIFAAAIVPEAERSPSIDVSPAQESDDPDGIWAPWTEADDEKRD